MVQHSVACVSAAFEGMKEKVLFRELYVCSLPAEACTLAYKCVLAAALRETASQLHSGSLAAPLRTAAIPFPLNGACVMAPHCELLPVHHYLVVSCN